VSPQKLRDGAWNIRGGADARHAASRGRDHVGKQGDALIGGKVSASRYDSDRVFAQAISNSLAPRRLAAVHAER
jgi:hypothetical protein